MICYDDRADRPDYPGQAKGAAAVQQLQQAQANSQTLTRSNHLAGSAANPNPQSVASKYSLYLFATVCHPFL